MRPPVFLITLLLACSAGTCCAQDSFDFSALDSLELYVMANPGVTINELPSGFRDILIEPTAICNETLGGAIALGSVFFGIGFCLPIHRWILGGYGVGQSILYMVTLGGCGCIPLVEGIMLLASGDSGRYCDCSKFLLLSCKKKPDSSEE